MTVCERSAPADSKTSKISPGESSPRPGWIMRGAPGSVFGGRERERGRGREGEGEREREREREREMYVY